ncbi:hypothetical protein N474_01455 [Pseudoalteromonas luteoviolacea CPMOR-2]|uniref:Uncharacterized protein n=1 Tax=Pseudoalteromonas luteoviolacea DSM 6061 TaxID=1365250 RepID=A0A166WUY7_9GAMM|nr:hypothetical protein [Pseudoalteromonas luteoviolacea]KZN38106.1 hypothetical protein N475_15875 [Pseudoalteromonas luteoviolacea DSM 6061]KZN54408.1 hypothetical protein N474_01455 [Pseudoalteromonas luteoviolacea CPMOR-2]MBE0388872.1 hypothetical protein [Pseudoalteromonas luteoviolacea DSM 6061]
MKYVAMCVFGLIITALLFLGMAKLIETNSTEKQTRIECFPIPSDVFESEGAKNSCKCWFVSQHVKTLEHPDGIACNALFLSQSEIHKLPVCLSASANLSLF